MFLFVHVHRDMDLRITHEMFFIDSYIACFKDVPLAFYFLVFVCIERAAVNPHIFVLAVRKDQFILQIPSARSRSLAVNGDLRRVAHMHADLFFWHCAL